MTLEGREIGTFLVSGLLLGIFMVWNLLLKGRRDEAVEEPAARSWVRAGTLVNLYVYPVKSGRFQSLDQARCTSMGLATLSRLPLLIDGQFSSTLDLRDRFFVVYRESGEFVTGRTYPKMVLLQTEVESGDKIKFSFPDKESIELKFPLEQNETTLIKLWNEKVPAVDCGPKIAEWVSDVLLKKPTGLRMGFWAESIKQRRDVESTQLAQLYKGIRNEDTGAYSDLSSFLLINKSSVEDMNRVIGDETEFSPLNFRPNFVIEGLQPYAEDDLKWIRIGEEAVFKNFKPCTRCSFTTIDPFTGERHPRQEPIKTLRKYRQLKDPVLREAEHGSPVMGINIGLHREGLVKVGDPVYVSS